MSAYRHLAVLPASSPLPADERRPIALESEFDGARRPEPRSPAPSDPARYSEIFCGGTD